MSGLNLEIRFNFNINTYSLISGFINSVDRFPGRTALEVNGEPFTYKRLSVRAHCIMKTIFSVNQKTNDLVAILACRSEVAYAGVLGILGSGKGYVPLNPNFPVERNCIMLDQSGCQTMVVGKECLALLSKILPFVKKSLTLILPDSPEDKELVERFSSHTFIFSNQIEKTFLIMPDPDVDSSKVAYLLFTSGSTGIPKGVPVTHNNITAYLNYMTQRYAITEQDRFSQLFDMTFDVSVHDMFVCWWIGACLCSVPKNSIMMPAKFIIENKLSVWYSVPSVGIFMSRMRVLEPGCFPSIRYSFFAGEAFPVSLAEKWQSAAPNSIIENLYGPTETTITCTHYRWEGRRSAEMSHNGIVPIGTIHEGHKYCLINEHLEPVPKGSAGELCVTGPQVAEGYLNNPEKTKSQYIRILRFGRQVWYRTGDLVKESPEGELQFIERVDNQVQILGYRVELSEVDHVLRMATGLEMLVSVAWPIKDGTAVGIVSFICDGDESRLSEIMTHCRKILPEYMVPKRILFIDEMPLNGNGKINRKQLIEKLEVEITHVS